VLGEVALALGWQDTDRPVALDLCLDRASRAIV
jgi:hypothetical protein